MKNKPINHPIQFTVASSGASAYIDSNTDQDHGTVEGFFINCDEDITGSIIDELLIDNDTIVKEIDAKNFVPSSNNDRTYKDVAWYRESPANGSPVKMKFTDGGSASSYPYTATLQLLCTELD
jgi:hypothetical protein